MPRIGRIIGQGLRMFNDARQEVEDVITTEILRPEDAQMLKDPFGMKEMQKDLQKTVNQISDPKYKPVPKGAGMRVSTDGTAPKPRPEVVELESVVPSVEDLHEEAAEEEPKAPVTIDTADAASIWGATTLLSAHEDTADAGHESETLVELESEEVDDAR